MEQVEGEEMIRDFRSIYSQIYILCSLMVAEFCKFYLSTEIVYTSVGILWFEKKLKY